MRDKIAGALYGMALGDAMGMPAELWGRKRVKEVFGRIEGLLEGMGSYFVLLYFKMGVFRFASVKVFFFLEFFV